MKWRRVAGIVAAMAGAGAAGWAGYDWYQGQHKAAPTAAATAPATTLDEAQVAGGVETIDVSGDPTNPEAGTTPMKDRVAVLGLLNKRNGQARDVTLKPGQAMRIGNVVVRLRACAADGGSGCGSGACVSSSVAVCAGACGNACKSRGGVEFSRPLRRR